MTSRLKQCLPLFLMAVIASISHAYADEEGSNDPLEGMNRAIFAFNNQADRFVLKPIAQGYKFVTPDPVEHGLSRAFNNLGEILNVANDLLQGKFGQAANDSGRFVVNSTIGLVGFFDVASDMGLEKNDGEDFGQTLGKWGVKPGPYIVLPFFGPSNLRDAPSKVVDTFANPIGYIDHVPTRNSLFGADIVITRAELLEAEKLISGDKYVFFRDVYLQRRNYLVNDGLIEDSFDDDFEDDGYEDY